MSFAETAFQFDPTVTVHCNNSLYAVHDPERAEWCSVDFPIHIWWDVSAFARILVLTSTQTLAKNYLELTRRMEKPSPVIRDYMMLANEEGGSIHYDSWLTGLPDRKFDYVICSDPLGAHSESVAMAYLATIVLPRVIP